jgi:hypothetical protein
MIKQEKNMRAKDDFDFSAFRIDIVTSRKRWGNVFVLRTPISCARRYGAEGWEANGSLPVTVSLAWVV